MEHTTVNAVVQEHVKQIIETHTKQLLCRYLTRAYILKHKCDLHNKFAQYSHPPFLQLNKLFWCADILQCVDTLSAFDFGALLNSEC